MSVDAVHTASHRLRKRYREILQEQIASTLEDPSELDDEIRSLFAALGRNQPAADRLTGVISSGYRNADGQPFGDLFHARTRAARPATASCQPTHPWASARSAYSPHGLDDEA